ncbi:MAG: hypothetical protein KA973_13400 [Candidatus Microthrix sp.]|uniref:hypothetical protein n=1 Tax=Candidatus Neomicrothrix parvicella TaxID=41950 RepID=UPI00036E1F7A|nr:MULTISPECIES: hypothetical protein [Microthrix]MBK7323768.1 hypothetical protein [Candidatus Microthrix sp.]MBP7405904.1 hypothetical protein [Candidatus Microthrix sp.]
MPPQFELGKFPPWQPTTALIVAPGATATVAVTFPPKPGSDFSVPDEVPDPAAPARAPSTLIVIEVTPAGTVVVSNTPQAVVGAQSVTAPAGTTPTSAVAASRPPMSAIDAPTADKILRR